MEPIEPPVNRNGIQQFTTSLAARIQSLLFPLHCRLCGTRLATGPALCSGCRSDLPWLDTACRQCARSLPHAGNGLRCGACQKRSPAFDVTTAVLHYRPPADYLIQRLKFSGELAIAPLLSTLLAAKIAGRQSPLPELILPVPLHHTRLRERGFNQATELARHLGRTLDIPLDHRLCKRMRKTEPQSLLPVNARRLNLRNAFSTTGKLPARHIAIVDDVMTSGHTAGELSRVLKRAGAEKIEIWVIARAGR